MNAEHFETLLRSLSAHPSRRGALRLLSGSALGGFLGWREPGPGEAHDPSQKCRKKSGDKKKKCLKKARKHNASHATETPPDGAGGTTGPTCQSLPDGSDCGGGKQCSGGVCATPPGCANNAGCIHGNMCCSGACACQTGQDAQGYCNGLDPGDCTNSGVGEKCSSDSDCGNGNCVGFICQEI